MFELGYDSDGNLPYLGDSQFEKALLEAYNAEEMPADPPSLMSVGGEAGGVA